MNKQNEYRPDILNCMANLSNDEVFTSPVLVNEMLDLLPSSIWSDPNATFLDPCSKTGVFLREITKRLLKGQIKDYDIKLGRLNQERENIRERLKHEPAAKDSKTIDSYLEDKSKLFLEELQRTVNHILTKQVYGIAITELTSLMSRRTLYCSKDSNAYYSIAEGEFGDDTRLSKLPDGTLIDNPQNAGHIIYERLDHKWDKNGNCVCCGANKNTLDRGIDEETYAYPFIHWSIKEIKEKLKMSNFHIDVVAMNPPYQLNDGGGTGDSAKPIYNKFIEKAIDLNPRYIVSINPSRWFKGGKGLDKFRLNMMNDTHIRELHDFEDASECFPNVHIDGGVNYFLWDRNYDGPVRYVFTSRKKETIESLRYLKSDLLTTVVRDYRQVSIIEKVLHLNEPKFNRLVSALRPYGFRTFLFNTPEAYPEADLRESPAPGYCKIYGVKGKKGGAKRLFGYVRSDSVNDTNESLGKYKLFFSYSYSTDATVPPEIIIGQPNEICTETFLSIGPFNSDEEAKNCLSYIKTKFFRALLMFNRIGIHVSSETLALIPIQDFSKSWTDAELYAKYGLTQEEIDFIESNIKEMK